MSNAANNMYPQEEFLLDLESTPSPLPNESVEREIGAQVPPFGDAGVMPDSVPIATAKPGSINDPMVVFNSAADSMGAGQVPLSSIPVKAVAGSKQRMAVLLTNTSNANTIYIGSSLGQVNNGGGYILNPLTSLTLPISCDIYASASAPALLTYITMERAL